MVHDIGKSIILSDEMIRLAVERTMSLAVERTMRRMRRDFIDIRVDHRITTKNWFRCSIDPFWHSVRIMLMMPAKLNLIDGYLGLSSDELVRLSVNIQSNNKKKIQQELYNRINTYLNIDFYEKSGESKEMIDRVIELHHTLLMLMSRDYFFHIGSV